MASRLELRGELPVVVDLTIEGDPDRRRFVGQWLLTVGNVDNAQPSMAQRHSRGDPVTVSVGAAMVEEVQHSSETRLVRNTIPISERDTANSAHRHLT